MLTYAQMKIIAKPLAALVLLAVFGIPAFFISAAVKTSLGVAAGSFASHGITMLSFACVYFGVYTGILTAVNTQEYFKRNNKNHNPTRLQNSLAAAAGITVLCTPSTAFVGGAKLLSKETAVNKPDSSLVIPRKAVNTLHGSCLYRTDWVTRFCQASSEKTTRTH